MNVVLVTGAAGFVGANFVRYWLREHPRDRVIALDALTYAGVRGNLADLEGPRLEFVHGSIADGGLVVDTLRSRTVDVVVNFAAESHNSLAVVSPGAFFDTNVVGTQRLLEAVRTVGVSRFHHISTCEVYGDLALDADTAFDEDSPYRPRTPYNAAKAGGDHAVRAYGSTYGVPFTITNCANNYGRRQFPEKVIPLFTIRALRGQPLPLYASSRNRREWLHVVDHCAAVDRVLHHGREQQTYHVGSGLELDVEQIADTVLARLGLGPELKTVVPDRPGHDRRYLLDASRIRSELGWSPRIAWEDGIADTVAWYRDNAAWWEPLLDRVPVPENDAPWVPRPDAIAGVAPARGAS